MVIPSMGGREIGDVLRFWAAKAKRGEAIVELGCWLGAGTAQMAAAIVGKDVELHSYDRFRTSTSEKAKAAREGVELEVGQDTMAWVAERLSPIGARVFLHKGKISAAKWKGRRIALHVDDACKQEGTFIDALRKFSPFWIPGRTVVVLMDYWYFLKKPEHPWLKFQHSFVSARPEMFRQIWILKELCCAAFVYRGGLTFPANRASVKKAKRRPAARR